MGWWSTEINGGDTPMDIESTLATFMGLDLDEASEEWSTPVESGRLTYEVVRRFIANDIGLVNKMFNNNESSILYTVLGELLMEAGAKIPAKFRKDIIGHARLDAWADESPEREIVIEEFIEALENYVDGVPAELARGAVFNRAAKPDYIGAEPSGLLTMLPLADLMPRIGAVLIKYVNSNHPPIMYNVVGYTRGRLVCRCGSEERIVTLDNLRHLQDHEDYELRLFELNELTIIG